MNREECEQRLEELSKLEYGYDTYNGLPPDAEAIATTRALIELLKLVPDEIDPDAGGGVVLWFYTRDNAMLNITIYNGGKHVIDFSQTDVFVPFFITTERK